jgi:hypothetical protein
MGVSPMFPAVSGCFLLFTTGGTPVGLMGETPMLRFSDILFSKCEAIAQQKELQVAAMHMFTFLLRRGNWGISPVDLICRRGDRVVW